LIAAGTFPSTIACAKPSTIAVLPYRGAFEENIQKLVEGVKSSQNAVLFFDEIHQIILNAGFKISDNPLLPESLPVAPEPMIW
jgi:hypothetical protein